jgi:hypothetical protein
MIQSQMINLVNGVEPCPSRITHATNDRVGACGAKLLNGFRETPVAGRGTVPTVRHHQRTTKNARCQESFLRHCSASEAVGSLTMRCSA